jgi:hypothetical protein
MLPGTRPSGYLAPSTGRTTRLPDQDYYNMVRKLFFTVTACGLLFTACGDDKGSTDTAATTPLTTTGDESTAGTNNTTMIDEPTTAGPTTSDDTTGVVDPSTSTGPVDPSTSTGPDPDTTTPTTVDTTTDPDPGTSSETTDPSGGDPVEECKMMADPMNACSDCVCENCLEQLQACQADEGCVAIRMCAEETGCTGIDCLGACGDVINMYGGIGGESAMIGLQISMCLDQNCADQCG